MKVNLMYYCYRRGTSVCLRVYVRVCVLVGWIVCEIVVDMCHSLRFWSRASPDWCLQRSGLRLSVIQKRTAFHVTFHFLDIKLIWSKKWRNWRINCRFCLTQRHPKAWNIWTILCVIEKFTRGAHRRWRTGSVECLTWLCPKISILAAPHLWNQH